MPGNRAVYAAVCAVCCGGDGVGPPGVEQPVPLADETTLQPRRGPRKHSRHRPLFGFPLGFRPCGVSRQPTGCGHHACTSGWRSVVSRQGQRCNNGDGAERRHPRHGASGVPRWTRRWTLHRRPAPRQTPWAPFSSSRLQRRHHVLGPCLVRSLLAVCRSETGRARRQANAHCTAAPNCSGNSRLAVLGLSMPIWLPLARTSPAAAGAFAVATRRAPAGSPPP